MTSHLEECKPECTAYIKFRQMQDLNIEKKNQSMKKNLYLINAFNMAEKFLYL